jgi:hypothetical protein
VRGAADRDHEIVPYRDVVEVVEESFDIRRARSVDRDLAVLYALRPVLAAVPMTTVPVGQFALDSGLSTNPKPPFAGGVTTLPFTYVTLPIALETLAVVAFVALVALAAFVALSALVACVALFALLAVFACLTLRPGASFLISLVTAFLFKGPDVLAANAVPPSTRLSATREITRAGLGRRNLRLNMETILRSELLEPLAGNPSGAEDDAAGWSISPFGGPNRGHVTNCFP